MARFAVGVLFGVVVGVVAGAAAGLHADEVDAEVQAAASEAHVDPVALQGAVNTVGVDPYVYLRGTGELPPLEPASVASVSRVDCIVRAESRGNPGAINPRSGAAGLGQFLPSTWRSTPQGKAGASPFNASANRAAIGWMLAAGRAREFVAVSAGLC
jgi:hypothetical protein